MTWKDFESVNTIASFAGGLIGVLSALFSVLAWLKTRQIRKFQAEKERRRSEQDRLIIVNEGTKADHVLGYRPRRDQATRAEIVGILGIYYGEPRFQSSRLVPILESGEFDRMFSGSTTEVRFPVSAADFERFRKRDGEL